MSTPPPKSKRRAARDRLDAFSARRARGRRVRQGFQTELRKDYPRGLNSAHIFRTAQAVFEADVARRNDLPNYIALRKLRQADRAQDESHRQRERGIEQRERQLELAREKFEFDAAARCSITWRSARMPRPIHAHGKISRAPPLFGDRHRPALTSPKRNSIYRASL